MNLLRILTAPPHRLLSVGLVALALVGSQSAHAQTTTGKEQLVVALTSPKQPGSLHVKQVAGSIHIIGYEGKEVIIDAVTRESVRRQRSATPPAEATGLRRIDTASGFELTAVEKDNRVTIHSNSLQRAVDLTIRVPMNFSLQVGTVQQGDIEVENVTGELEISNVNGSIRLSQVGGSALLNTVNGELVASFKTVTPNAPMAFSTVNGKIDVTFPHNLKADLKLKSDMGAVFSDFDMSVEKSPKPTTTAQNGVYRVSHDTWTYGKVNGGGAEITLKSLQGNLYVRKAK